MARAGSSLRPVNPTIPHMVHLTLTGGHASTGAALGAKPGGARVNPSYPIDSIAVHLH
jgi:hypothetical protein